MYIIYMCLRRIIEPRCHPHLFFSNTLSPPNQVKGFSTIYDSVLSSLRILMRDFDYKTLQDANAWFTMFFFVFFTCVVIFVLLVIMMYIHNVFFKPIFGDSQFFFTSSIRFPDDVSGDRVSRIFWRGRRTIFGGPATVRERQGVGVRGPRAGLDGFWQMGGATSNRPAEQRTGSQSYLSGRLQDTETVHGIIVYNHIIM